MYEITLKGLKFKRVRLWLERAKDRQKEDPIDALICAWIGFNHYYSTYCARDEVQDALYQHANKPKGTYLSDFKQINFLCDQEDFKHWFQVLRRNDADLFKQVISLPIDKMETIRRFPISRKVPGSFVKATAKMTMIPLYEIRTNLFHGHKDPEDERDLSVCTWAASILIPLLDLLLSNTTGETLNTYDLEPEASPLRTAVE
jgi:hypothetical protein